MAITSVQSKRTTRHHRCDEQFVELLEQDFGIDAYSLRKAFIGVLCAPRKQAIAVCEWAVRSTKGDVDEAGDALRAWARKHKVGAYKPRLMEAPGDGS
jgi:hypothetical protein